jgi:hypothetical protein
MIQTARRASRGAIAKTLSAQSVLGLNYSALARAKMDSAESRLNMDTRTSARGSDAEIGRRLVRLASGCPARDRDRAT